MRLFFAIELPPDIQTSLGRLKPTDDQRDYRWADHALLHVTLAFLGEQPESRLADLQEVGAAAAVTSEPGVLRLGKAGHFGSTRAPRVLWVDLAGNVAALGALQAHLVSQLQRLEFPIEERPFRAHVTLARRRETASGGPPPGWPPEIEHASFRLWQLTLMHSRLSPRGPTYTPLAHFPIGS